MVEKFCFVVPLNLGTVLLGAINIIISTAMIVIPAVYLSSDKDGLVLPESPPHVHLHSYFKLYLDEVSLPILLAAVMATGGVWLLMSIILIFGVCRNSPSWVLGYFFFGIVLIIFAELGALLVLLKNCWILALILFLVSLLYIHFQMVVYTVYEQMQKGRNFSFHRLEEDDVPILEVEDVA